MSHSELHLIIVSKDRALQLDSLLRSISTFFVPAPNSITILYNSSNLSFENGYTLLKNRQHCSSVTWYRETSFTDDFRCCVDRLPPDSLVQFMTDDDILFRPFNREILKDFSHSDLFFSLRVDRVYKRFPLPRFKVCNETIRWRWNPLFSRRSTSFWTYPFSVDGNIFHTADIQLMVAGINFRAPNSLEGAMHKARKQWSFQRKGWGVTLSSGAVLFNNPLNTVQQEGENWNQSVSVSWLNDLFLAGKEIDNRSLYSAIPDDVHFAVTLQLKGQ